ncbi:SDR family oxidoreductase [Lyngbya confervoides]|uniref:SDR family oxidoreductase n=1 Tax=Lyngbya confervoides BDU141951 TaxID=1574623 RepID=A0ABD4T7D4_9CYAN|nr:SDR family oxidoreductase [Lyngbya confervoides]MCM1984541.1 SDR family oxidoreductase [Lyngbya confervoides BDU141951]
MKTLLITGASGFLGWYLCQAALRQGWRVQGSYFSHPVQIPDVEMYPLNLTEINQIEAHLKTLKPDAIIHCAARARAQDCQENPEATHGINVTAALGLARWGRDRPFVFISTNQVFDGRQAPYGEADPVSPINVYGQQKASAEAAILADHPQATICRMPLLFGVAPTAPSFLQALLQQLHTGQSLDLFTDEFRTPVYAADAAQGILMALEHEPRILHLGGVERLSRYEFGQILVSVLGLPDSCLRPCLQADVPTLAPRAPDLTLDSRQALSLGYAPQAVRPVLERILP